ncbi:MAG: RMD1 family protein [Bdellovibrionota bacterium]
MSETYTIDAYSTPVQINLKEASSYFRDLPLKRLDSGSLYIQISEKQLVFLYNYGSVVFVDIDEKQQSEILIGLSLIGDSKRLTHENDEFTEDYFKIVIEGQETKVSFSSVQLPEWNINTLSIVAGVLAQSSALDILEREVEKRLENSESFAKQLSSFRKPRRKDILLFISDGLNLSHQVVKHLALFNDPELLWEHEELHKLYSNLQSHFEIESRISKINQMLEISRDVSELHFWLHHAYRTEFLEIIIIALILIEVVAVF